MYAKGITTRRPLIRAVVMLFLLYSKIPNVIIIDTFELPPVFSFDTALQTAFLQTPEDPFLSYDLI